MPRAPNLYQYVGNNPASYADPFGLCPWCVVVAGAWALYELGSSAYDVVNAVRTVADVDASVGAKIGTVALAGVSIVGPGGGYTSLGNNLRKAGKVATGRLRGTLRVNTDLKGGMDAAKSVFRSLTGKSPSGSLDRVILDDGREVLFRSSSRTKTPKVEVVDPDAKVLEKITFQD